MLGTLECKSLVRLDFPGHCRINAVAIKTIFFCDDSRMILARFAGRQASGDDFLGTFSGFTTRHGNTAFKINSVHMRHIPAAVNPLQIGGAVVGFHQVNMVDLIPKLAVARDESLCDKPVDLENLARAISITESNLVISVLIKPRLKLHFSVALVGIDIPQFIDGVVKKPGNLLFHFSVAP